MKKKKYIENIFQFSFNTEEDKLNVLNKSPWPLSNSLFIIKEWTLDLTYKVVDLAKVAFWFQIYELLLV